MSFMFNPYPFDDLSALNNPQVVLENNDTLREGNQNVASFIAEKALNIYLKEKKAVIGIDGYATAFFDDLIHLVSRKITEKGKPVIPVNISECYKNSHDLELLFSESLPKDKKVDPSLLFGKLFEGKPDSFFEKDKSEKMIKSIDSLQSSGIVLVYGNFCSVTQFQKLFDVTIYIDVIPKDAVLRYKNGMVRNIGDDRVRTYREVMRRAYYCDFELSVAHRTHLLQNQLYDYYVAGSKEDHLQILSRSLLEKICRNIAIRPFRCKPVYNEGVWGGYYTKKYRGLPDKMRNCAWVFDLIPAEVSLLCSVEETLIDIPFYTFLRMQSLPLLGEQSISQFGEYFPIRFNYDDTMHSSGNMSIQVHPGESFVKSHFNELGRQDESYYIVDTGLGAKTYCGLNDDTDTDEFFSLIKESEVNGTPIDYKQLVNGIPTKPGMQFMLPAGTIHSSGQNQLVLEIGSLTIGSYTFKLYDYVRKDLDGTPRPIHSVYGEEVLRKERNASWVQRNLLKKPIVIDKGVDWKDLLIGEHELIYFCMHRLGGMTSIPQNTNGKFHVLTLVDGEKVKIIPDDNPSCAFAMNYLDIVVVPASVGSYTIKNMTDHPFAVHQTMLKETESREK